MLSMYALSSLYLRSGYPILDHSRPLPSSVLDHFVCLSFAVSLAFEVSCFVGLTFVSVCLMVSIFPFPFNARILLATEIVILIILVFVQIFKNKPQRYCTEYEQECVKYEDIFSIWHPLLMTLAFPVSMSFSLLAFRQPPLCVGKEASDSSNRSSDTHRLQKYFHAAGHVVTVALASAAFAEIYQSKYGSL